MSKVCEVSRAVAPASIPFTPLSVQAKPVAGSVAYAYPKNLNTPEPIGILVRSYFVAALTSVSCMDAVVGVTG
jgi:hypothetical protein